MTADNLNDVFGAAANWYAQERDAAALKYLQNKRKIMEDWRGPAFIKMPSRWTAEQIKSFRAWYENLMSGGVSVMHIDGATVCQYCHGITTNDARGHCSACGAPRGE